MPKILKLEDNKIRDDILHNILEIIGIKNNTDTFLLSKMDSDETTQNNIYNLEQDIKKYYKTGKWACFTKPTKRKWLSILKYICKEHNYVIESSEVRFSHNIYDRLYKITITST